MRPTQHTVNKHLPCELSDKELQEIAENLSHKFTELNGIEIEKKDANDQWKNQISCVNKEISVLCKKLRERAEERPVEVEVTVDRKNDKYT